MIFTLRRSASRALLGAVAFLAACTQGFYVSESELAAYTANLRDEATATELFEPLRDLLITVEFDTSEETPRIVASDIADALRATRLVLLEQLFRQVRLERLSKQLERSLEVWLQDSFRVVRAQSNNEAQLKGLRRLQIRILAPPVLHYRAATQQIEFDTTVRVSVGMTVQVNDPDGFLSIFIAPFVPDGTYPVTIVADSLRLRGSVDLRGQLGDVATLRLTATPTAGSVTVAGNAPDEVREPLAAVARFIFSSPVHDAVYLGFDQFTVTDVHLSDDAPARLQISSGPRPSITRPEMDVVARAADGMLYHIHKAAGSWTAAVPIPFPTGTPALGEPALVASAPDRLDLTAVDAQGALHYASSRAGRWGEYFSSRSITAVNLANAPPVSIATTPGQLEVIALAAGGGLAHLRRLRGRWSTGVFVDYRPAQPPIAAPAMTRVGESVLLVFTDSRGWLFGKVFDLITGSWGETFALEIQGGAAQPALAACGDGRVDLVYGSGGSLRHRALTFTAALPTRPATVSPSEDLSVAARAAPSLQCAGYQRVALVVVNRDRKLMQNMLLPNLSTRVHDGRALVAGWQGWETLDEHFFGTLGAWRVDGKTALGGSASDGYVAVVARRSGSGARSLVENSTESGRYGVAPWRAVHWRGFSHVDPQRILGTAALAAADRQLDIAVVGAGGRVRTARWWSNDALERSGVSDFAPAPGRDPTGFSSGPGLLDVLYVGSDGRPRHYRRESGTVRGEQFLSGTVSARMSAAAGAGGRIDAVGIGGDRGLYHWVFEAGTWSTWRQIGGRVISDCVLIRANPGELDLFAVGDDQYLRRFRYVDGVWDAGAVVDRSVRVNALLFGQNAVARAGDGAIALAVVEDGTGRVLFRRLSRPSAAVTGPAVAATLLEPGFEPVPDLQATDVPSLAVLADRSAHLLVRGAGGAVLAARLPGLRVAGAPVQLGGPRWETPYEFGNGIAMLGNLVPSAPGELAALAVAPNGSLYVASTRSGRWVGLRPLPQQGTDLRHAPLFRPQLVSHLTN